MTDQATTNVVRHTVTVPIDAEDAFRLFTEDIGTWWPSDTHKIGEGPVTEVFEGREGGRWYERAEDGSECVVGTMLTWEPPRRLVMAWQLKPDWSFEPDLDRATHVEVTFEPADAGTRVTLEHRGFERYGEAGQELRDAVDTGDGGWPDLLKMYAERAKA